MLPFSSTAQQSAIIPGKCYEENQIRSVQLEGKVIELPLDQDSMIVSLIGKINRNNRYPV